MELFRIGIVALPNSGLTIFSGFGLRTSDAGFPLSSPMPLTIAASSVVCRLSCYKEPLLISCFLLPHTGDEKRPH